MEVAPGINVELDAGGEIIKDKDTQDVEVSTARCSASASADKVRMERPKSKV